MSGLGAATADAAYGGVAGFGLTVVSSLLVRHTGWLRFLGGVFLCYLGVRTFLARPATRAAASRGTGLVGAYGSTLLLTLTNPATILSFAAVFAGLGVASAETAGQARAALVLIAGVFLGSAAWWLLLSGIVGLFRGRFDATWLRWVNRLSGAVLLGFGLVALAA